MYVAMQSRLGSWQHHGAAHLPTSAMLLLCCCRWVAFVEAVQNDTTEKAQEAYNRLLLAVTDMELMVRRRNVSSFSNSSCRVLQANSKI
jgi:hypothetical protein